MNPDAKGSGPVQIHRNPVFWLVVGGILGSYLIDFYFRPSYAGVTFPFALTVLGFGLLVLMGRSIPDEVGILLVGIGVFLVLAGLQSYRTQLKHQQVNNRRLHLVGRLDPPHEFTVHRVNGARASFRFFLLDPPSSPRGRFVGSEVRELDLTGRVEWYSLEDSFLDYLGERGYHGALSPLTLHGVRDVQYGEGLMANLRNRITAWLRGFSTRAPYSTSMMKALLTGDRHFPTHLEMLLRRLGMVHLFVISGFHVGLIFLLLRSITSPVSRSIRVIFMGLVLFGYLWFLGWPISATRAGVMIGFGALATALNRRTALFDVLLATVLVLMVLDPFVVFDVGFQLSVAAVAGIQLVYPTLRSMEGGYVRTYFWVSVGAYIGTLPVILYHFQYVAPLALPGSVLAGLLFPLFLGVLLLQGIFLAVEWTYLMQWIEFGLARGIGLLLRPIERSGWVWGVPEPSVWIMTLLMVSLTLVLLSSLSKTVRMVGTGVAILLILTLTMGPRQSFVEVRAVSTLPVTMFRTKGGLEGLVVSPGERLDEYRVRQVSRLLKDRGMHHVDYFISDYSRRLFAQFSANFSVGTFESYRELDSKLDWEGGYFDVSNLQLKSGDTIISFDSKRFNGVLEDGSEAIVATTSDGRCVVNETDRMDAGSFDRLRSLDCELTFLSEGPLVYAPGAEASRSFELPNEAVSLSDVPRTLLQIR